MTDNRRYHPDAVPPKHPILRALWHLGGVLGFLAAFCAVVMALYVVVYAIVLAL